MRTLHSFINRHWSRWLGCLALAVALTAAAVQAAPKVDADPNKDYRITPEVGAYVVCAASYTGPSSEALAKQLVLLLRERDNLPSHYFDRGAKERQEQEDHLNKLRQFSDPDARIRKVRIPDQYAVLIGGYPDMDAARRTLTTVKKLKMPELKTGPNQSAYDTTIDPQTGRILAINPFAHAFVSRNPTAAAEQPQQKTDDPFLKELNANEEFSLLQMRKPFTLAVKEYHGISVTKSNSSSLLDKIGLGKKSTDTLSASALQAHELAKLMRSHLKLDAYVLHTRRSSVVAVGGFESLEDPELQRMQSRLATLKFQTGNGSTMTATPNADVLQLFSPAIPMRVPRP